MDRIIAENALNIALCDIQNLAQILDKFGKSGEPVGDDVVDYVAARLKEHHAEARGAFDRLTAAQRQNA